jgi:hypothetical protein
LRELAFPEHNPNASKGLFWRRQGVGHLAAPIHSPG